MDVFYYVLLITNFICYFFNRSNKGFRIIKSQYGIWCVFILLLLMSLNIWSPILDHGIDIDSPNGIDISTKYVLKTLILIIYLISIILLPPKVINWSALSYVRGFIVAVFTHAIYSLIQLVTWYGFQDDIHTQLLNSFGITEETAGHVLVNYLILGVIRPSGLHWDPAYFGLWGAIVLMLSIYCHRFLYKLKLKSILICILGIIWFLSFSRTGYFAMLMTIIVITFLKRFNQTIYRINFKGIIRNIILILFLGIGGYSLLPLELQKTFDTALAYRFSHDESDQGSSRHLLYPVYTVEGMLHDPFHLFFGYGARNSSRAIYYSDNITYFVDTPEAFDIESDLCKMLANYGIIYFCLYLYFNYKIVRIYVKKCDFRNTLYPYFFLLSDIAVFFAGFFYMYNDSRWVWLIYLYSLIFVTRPDLFNKSNYVQNRCLYYYCKL